MSNIVERLRRASLSELGLDIDKELLDYAANTIKQRDAEIERLRGLADYWHRMHDAVHDEKEHLRAERDELVAALRSADCPAGGFNGMPKYAAGSVETCLHHNVCGCSFGAAIVKAEGRKYPPYDHTFTPVGGENE